MFVPEDCVRQIEEEWRKEGKRGALKGVVRALTANVTHLGLGGESCTIEELDRNTMRTIGLHVGVLAGEANTSFELVEKLKDFDLYKIPGLPLRAEQYLGNPCLKDVYLSPA